MYPQKSENLDKTWNLAENLDKTWNVKIYNISILYWDKIFQDFYCCDFRTLLASAFFVQKFSQYNLENSGNSISIWWI